MEVTEVRTYGTIKRDVVLADMDGVTFRAWATSKYEAQPFLVQVDWCIPLTPAAEPSRIEAFGHRVLKSGALGAQATKVYWSREPWPAWVTSAVEASRPTIEDLVQ